MDVTQTRPRAGWVTPVGAPAPGIGTQRATRLRQKIVNKVRGLHALDPKRITVVGIDGPTAAGKSMLADALAAALRKSGLKTWTFQLDWALKDRAEREADVAHLRQIGAAFEYEGELHMRLKLARKALEAIASFNRQIQLGNTDNHEVALAELYSRAAGGTVTGTDVLALTTGMIVIVDGHYTLRNELDALIDVNIVLLSDPKELLTRKVNRVKGYRSPTDAVHYFWHIDLPSFNHHLVRFGRNADLIVDNTDYRSPKFVGGEAMSQWLRKSCQESIAKPRRLQDLGDIPEYVLSESRLVPTELSQILTAAVQAVINWDMMVGHYLRVAIEEVEEDLETDARRATEDLNRDFQESSFRARLSHTDAFYRVYHRKLPLTLGLEIYHAASNRTAMAVLAEVDRDSLRVGMFWEGGVKWVRFARSLGGISTSEFKLLDGVPNGETAPAAAKLKVFLPTEFTLPAFLEGLDIDPVFIGREQENISAARVLSNILHGGGVWIHRFALHREIRFFQYCLEVEGVPSVHVGNYLIAVNTWDPALKKRFREFCQQWATPVDRVAVTRTGHDAYDEVVEREKAEVREYVRTHSTRFAVKDGSIFGNIYDKNAIDTVLVELGTLLRSPYRILRKRAIDFLDQQFPGFALPTADLWTDVPEGAQKALSLGEFTGLSSSIMAEIYLWLALRNERAAVLGANVYDIRPTSLDARAFLDAAAERGCPIVLQCSLNAVGQKETHGTRTFHGYLQPSNGVEDFSLAVRRAARDLYLLTGKRPPLYGIGLDHVNVAHDQPPQRAKRFLQHALRSGGVTHVVLDGSDLFQLAEPGREELTRVYQRMNAWVLGLMDSPLDTFLRDMEVCISELNYVGGSEAYVPSTEDIRLFAETYGDALVDRGFACHIARPKLFVSNLGTRHHSTDEKRPWVELSREWRDAVKGDGFVSAVLHGTSRSHQDTLSAATVGCHKINVAGDFLDTIVENLPMPLSRALQDGDTSPKMKLAAIRPDMDRLAESETQKLYGALKEHCSRILKTIESPKISSMDANYFQYKDYEFSDRQVAAILPQVRRELTHLMPKAPRIVSDSRKGYAFAASMIEVPDEEFRGPVLKTLWDEGIRHFHVDAGDGEFIPRRFSGLEKVRYVRRHFPTSVIHAHLMVVNPHYPKDGEFAEIQQYAEAGVDAIAFHVRACVNYREAISAIKIVRRLNIRPGIVIETSDTVDENLEALITEQGLDWVVVMGVPIGYGGQVFQYSTLNRISRLNDLASRLGRDFLVECDGGLNLQNIELCRNAGGQLFSGWSIIKGQSIDHMKSKVRTVQGILSKSA
jgi:ribulose-phosphate 3-epimerase